MGVLRLLFRFIIELLDVLDGPVVGILAARLLEKAATEGGVEEVPKTVLLHSTAPVLDTLEQILLKRLHERLGGGAGGLELSGLGHVAQRHQEEDDHVDHGLLVCLQLV